MPLTSKELKISMPFDTGLGTRNAIVVSRLHAGSLADITPHYFMNPIGIEGCLIGNVSLPESNGRVQNTQGKILLVPPLNLGEHFNYSVTFCCGLDNTGKMEWPVKHPIEFISFSFSSQTKPLPYIWDISLSQADAEPIPIVPISSNHQNLEIQIQNPPKGSVINFAWSS